MIYFDNAATTKTDSIAIETLKRYSIDNFYNPSALYREASDNYKALNQAREDILKLLHGNGNFVFTSSGTESDNMAILGTKKPRNCRIIVGAGDHSAVINPAYELLNKGYDVVFAPINNDGSINLNEFVKLLNRNVCLVSIMHVSNETGAINDLTKIVKLTKSVAPDAIVHSDGVQALGKINVHLINLGVDLYSVSAHKIHAPRGVGGLYIKKGININPIIFGGGQEKGLRSATENLAGIVAFSEILNKNLQNLQQNIDYRYKVLNYMRDKFTNELPMHKIISPENSPHILTVALSGVRGEVMLHSLEEYGILIGVGSACNSKKGINKQQALLGLDEAHKEGIIRISISEENTLEEVDYFIDKLKLLTTKLSNYKRI